jgi:hypothetical protein
MRFLALCVVGLVAAFSVGCGSHSADQNTSEVKRLGSFASSPILDELYPCDIFAEPWDRGCEIDVSQIDLSALEGVDTRALPVFESRIEFTREDLENATHSCNGNSCEAIVEKPMYKMAKVLDVDVPIGLQMTARIKYEKAETEEGATLGRLTVQGEYKPIHIAKFVTVGVAFGVKVDTEMSAEKIFAFKNPDFFCEGNIGLSLPYLDLLIRVSENGVEFNNKLKVNSSFGQVGIDHPFSNTVKLGFDDLGEIVRDAHLKMSNDPKYNPDDPAYMDHLFDRVDQLYGFGA